MIKFMITSVGCCMVALSSTALAIEPPKPMNPWVGNSLLFAPDVEFTVGASAKCRHIAFDDDETLIATDAPPTIWDAKTLTPIATADVYPRHSLGVRFRSNGDLIAGSLGAFAIYRRNGNQLQLIHRVGPRETTIVHNWVRKFDGIHYDQPTKSLFVPATDGMLKFDLSNTYPRAVAILPISEASYVTDDLAYSAERIRRKPGTRGRGTDTVVVRKRLASGSYQEIKRFRSNHFCLAPNGRLITVSNKVFLIKGDQLSPIATLESVSKATFTDKALQFAYVLRGPKIRVVRLHIGGVNTITEIPVGITPTSLMFSPSGKHLATVDPHSGLRLYDYDQKTLKETTASRDRAADRFPLKAVRFLDSDRLLCQRAQMRHGEPPLHALVCIDTQTGEVVPTPTIDDKINPVGFNAGSTSYVPGPPEELDSAGDKRVLLNLERFNHAVACLVENGITKKAWAVADLRDAVISPDRSRLAIGSYAGFIHLVDIATIEDGE